MTLTETSRQRPIVTKDNDGLAISRGDSNGIVGPFNARVFLRCFFLLCEMEKGKMEHVSRDFKQRVQTGGWCSKGGEFESYFQVNFCFILEEGRRKVEQVFRGIERGREWYY